MPKSRQQKEREVQAVAEKLDKSKSVVFVNQERINVSDIEGLRKDLRGNNAELQSVKKTLLRLVFDQKKININADDFKGGIALAYSYGDEVAAAQKIFAFSKDHEGMQIIGGILENEVIAADKVKALAKLPGKQELLGTVVGTIQAPIAGFVRVLSGNIRNIINVLNALKESKS